LKPHENIDPEHQIEETISSHCALENSSPALAAEEVLLQKDQQHTSRMRPMDRSRSHQETLTKDEARKRMLSWKKTTRPLDNNRRRSKTNSQSST